MKPLSNNAVSKLFYLSGDEESSSQVRTTRAKYRDSANLGQMKPGKRTRHRTPSTKKIHKGLTSIYVLEVNTRGIHTACPHTNDEQNTRNQRRHNNC